MKNFSKTLFMDSAKYRSLIAVFLVNLITLSGEALGLTNLLGLLNGGKLEARMQTYYYRSIKSQNGSNIIQLIDTAVTAVDGVTNFQNGQLPAKDSLFAVGAIAIRFGLGATPVATTFSSAIYDSAGAARITPSLLAADIEIKCGNVIVLERQTIKKFFAERNINANNVGNTHFNDAVELIEPAYLVGGQNITATIYMPNGGAALVATANIEIEFYGVGTGAK